MAEKRKIQNSSKGENKDQLQKKLIAIPNTIIKFGTEVLIEAYKFITTPKKFAEVFILGIIIYVLTNSVVAPALAPKTNIEVDAFINISEQSTMEIIFRNNAPFAGEDFTINIDGLDSVSKSFDALTAEGRLCTIYRMQASTTQNFTVGTQIKCQYIPPNTSLKFKLIEPLLIRDSARTGEFEITYWGKTTPQETKKYKLSTIKLLN